MFPAIAGGTLAGVAAGVGGTLGIEALTGGSSKKDSVAPDNSAAIIEMAKQSAAAQGYASDKQFQVGMAQIGAQMLQAQSMYNLGQTQIDANLDLGRERMQTSLEIARLNYLQQMTAQEDRHAERMGDIDLRRYEIDHPAEGLV